MDVYGYVVEDTMTDNDQMLLLNDAIQSIKIFPKYAYFKICPVCLDHLCTKSLCLLCKDFIFYLQKTITSKTYRITYMGTSSKKYFHGYPLSQIISLYLCYCLIIKVSFIDATPLEHFIEILFT